MIENLFLISVNDDKISFLFVRELRNTLKESEKEKIPLKDRRKLNKD